MMKIRAVVLIAGLVRAVNEKPDFFSEQDGEIADDYD